MLIEKADRFVCAPHTCYLQLNKIILRLKQMYGWLACSASCYLGMALGWLQSRFAVLQDKLRWSATFESYRNCRYRLTRRRGRKGWPQPCPGNLGRETEAGSCHCAQRTRSFVGVWSQGVLWIWLVQYHATWCCSATGENPAEVCNDPEEHYHVEAAWPGEGGLVVSSQAAVESCRRNWLAAWQGRVLSLLL